MMAELSSFSLGTGLRRRCWGGLLSWDSEAVGAPHTSRCSIGSSVRQGSRFGQRRTASNADLTRCKVTNIGPTRPLFQDRTVTDLGTLTGQSDLPGHVFTTAIRKLLVPSERVPGWAERP